MRIFVVSALFIAIQCFYSCEIGDERFYLFDNFFSEYGETETELEEAGFDEAAGEEFALNDGAPRKFYLTCLKVTFIDDETGEPIPEATRFLNNE
ncbi:MAG: hypothetical protein FJ088_01155 [Deltaproteobacteria bacterium]|nr:hypothetical protein [Deltaproteobacteria bacterium]